MWAAKNPIKMKHKSRVKERTDFKIKKKERQSVPRCHIKCSKLEVRIGGLRLISSSKESTGSTYLIAVGVWEKQSVVVAITGDAWGLSSVSANIYLATEQIFSSLGLSFFIPK